MSSFSFTLPGRNSVSAPDAFERLRLVSGEHPPIASYAFLSDQRSACLVGYDGSVDWLCWPRFDSPSVLGRLLDTERGGSFTLRPVGDVGSTKRRYLPGGLVLETTYETTTGSCRVTDWMSGGETPVLYRDVRGVSGRVELEYHVQLVDDYGRAPLEFCRDEAGLVARGRDERRYWLVGGTSGRARFAVVEGEHHTLALSYAQPAQPDATEDLESTLGRWRLKTTRIAYDGPHRSLVETATLVLCGLQYAPSGAFLAAATTSLPEAIGGARNWDYRFSWLRDAAFTAQALQRVGLDEPVDRWLGFVDHVADRHGPLVDLMHTISGERDLPEHELGHLSGYRESRPVRIGNGAASQLQLDVPGEYLDAVLACRERTGAPLTDARFAIVEAFADHVCDRWHEPDDGIWEIRGQRQHFTYSKAYCWVALDRACRLAEHDGRTPARLEDWRRERDSVRRYVLERCVCPERSCFVQTAGSDALDASTLVLGRIGLVAPDDPRMLATIRAVKHGLGQDGLVHRYVATTDVDGIGTHESAFALCSFWLCLAKLGCGMVDEAEALFGRLCAEVNDVGILSEELDPFAPVGDRHRGNTPQAFSHLALVLCAAELAQARKPAARQLP